MNGRRFVAKVAARARSRLRRGHTAGRVCALNDGSSSGPRPRLSRIIRGRKSSRGENGALNGPDVAAIAIQRAERERASKHGARHHK